jgi:hypothetical protein
MAPVVRLRDYDDDNDDYDDADYLRITQLKVTVSSTPLYSRDPEPTSRCGDPES